jgi:hypothetical protein
MFDMIGNELFHGDRTSPVAGLTLARLVENAQKSVLALGRLISFGFRKKRHQADSRDAPLTSTPTTTISATGGRDFLLSSRSSVQRQMRMG